ncbi:MAG: hypothetical protein HYX69_15795 [Planctomycetia bacterium]|nr:hypothetical protein [Planctomycetia bacterium]
MRYFQPQLEALEDRLCLSVTVTSVAVANGNELRITGDSAADTVNIADAGNGHIEVTDASGTLLGSADNVTRVKVNTKGGEDVVNYALTGPLTNSESVTIYLGTGEGDSANIDLSQGVTGANLRMYVEGSAAADTIAATLGPLSDARVGLTIDGRAGDDNISVTSAAADIQEDASLRVQLLGGRGDDNITTTFDGELLGDFRYAVNGGQGADTIASDLTVASGSTGRLSASAAGGAGVDTVTLNVNDNSADDNGDSGLDRLHAVIFDPDESDILTHTDNVTEVTGFGLGHGRGWPRGGFGGCS